MRWLRERLEWEDQKVRQSVGVTILCLAILVILLLVPSHNGLSLLGAALKGSGSDIGLISDVIEGLSADDGNSGRPSRDGVNGSPENELRKRFLESGLVLDADLSSLFQDDADNPIQASEDSRNDRTVEDTAEDVVPAGSLGSSFGQLGAPVWARSSDGFGALGGGLTGSGLAGGGVGAGAGRAGAADGGARRGTGDTQQLTDVTNQTSRALSMGSADASGVDPGNASGAGDALGTGGGAPGNGNGDALTFLPDNAITGNNADSNITVYPASAGSTIVGDSSGPDPVSGPNNDGLTSAIIADPATVPEPTGLILLGSGLVVVARKLRR